MLILIVLLAWCSLISQENDPQTEIANPASEYCKENRWNLEIVPDVWWSRWKCNFDDGSFCEEWSYYHGECSPGRWDGNSIQIEDIENNNEINEEEKDEIVELVEEISKDESYNENDTVIVCTTDVKRCDDGSYVSRWWPNCEFLDCPWTGFDENILEQTLQEYKSSWSNLTESDIDLMNEIIDIVTQN